MGEDKEVEEEEPAKVIVAVDKDKNPCVDLQGHGVSRQTMLEGTSPLTFQSSQPPHQPILLRK